MSDERPVDLKLWAAPRRSCSECAHARNAKYWDSPVSSASRDAHRLALARVAPAHGCGRLAISDRRLAARRCVLWPAKLPASRSLIRCLEVVSGCYYCGAAEVIRMGNFFIPSHRIALCWWSS
jgi:hypothetical protein